MGVAGVERAVARILSLLAIALPFAACVRPPPIPETLIDKGERIFLNETFAGNGRTCGTCHRPEDNFGLSPAFIARLPADDALFVAERNSDLAQNFENPRLMRAFALILENQDGFDDLGNNFNMRGIPHTLALRTSVASAAGNRTGWGGDGSPGDGSLRSFAVGAVVQHFTKTLGRVPGKDFRLPTEEELDALEAFQLSLGRQEDLALPLPLTGVVPSRGQQIFVDNALGKCNFCHFNAGANADPRVFGAGAGNRNFDTGVEKLPDQPAVLTGERTSDDDGFGVPGNSEFNTPPLVEAADTGPFFHNNSVETIEGAVAFYSGDAFNGSPAGKLLANATGGPINLDATQVVAVAAFLRVINTLENIRAGTELIGRATAATTARARGTVLLARAKHEIEDAIEVLSGGGLHPAAVGLLQDARSATDRARNAKGGARSRYAQQAVATLERARNELVKSS
jgi:hypothetical protein